MKSLISLVFILLVASNMAFETATPGSVAKQLAWKIQCRIKQKGTFKISHYKNKEADLQKLQSREQELQQEKQDNAKSEALTEVTEAKLQEVTETIKAIEEAKETEESEYKDAEEKLQGQINTAMEAIGDSEADGDAKVEPGFSLAEVQEQMDQLNKQRKSQLNGNNDEVDLFMEDPDNSIELPNMCKYRLSSAELLELGVRGPEFKALWIGQYVAPADADENSPKPTYTNMNPLDAAHFYTFYGAIVTGADQEDGAVYPSSATEDQNEETQEIFYIATFNKQRLLINWLEFWVYMCANGVEPLEKEYMVDESEVDEAVVAAIDPIFAGIDEASLAPAAGRRNKAKAKSSKRVKKIAKKHSNLRRLKKI